MQEKSKELRFAAITNPILLKKKLTSLPYQPKKI